jgi:hypothetical protein
MQPSFNVNLAGWVDEVRGLARDVQLAALMPLEPVRG